MFLFDHKLQQHWTALGKVAQVLLIVLHNLTIAMTSGLDSVGGLSAMAELVHVGTHSLHLLVTTELHLAFVWLGNDLHEHITTLTVDVQSLATHNVDDQLTCGNVTSASWQCWHWFGCLQ